MQRQRAQCRQEQNVLVQVVGKKNVMKFCPFYKEVKILNEWKLDNK